MAKTYLVWEDVLEKKYIKSLEKIEVLKLSDIKSEIEKFENNILELDKDCDAFFDIDLEDWKKLKQNLGVE